MDREREPSSSSAAVGFRPWVLILLFSLLILLVLPSSFRGFRPFAIRNGWDTLIILLVLFAILCGVLSRRHGADDGDRLPRPADHGDWRRAHSSYAYPHPVEVAPEAGGLRMSSGGGSYPVLRPPLDAGAEEWRFYGDEQHYRRGSESGVWERERFADSEAKTISGDTYVERSSPLARSRSPSSLPPPTQRSMGSRTLYELPEGQGKKGDILEPEKPHPLSPLQPPPPAPPPPQRQSRMTRRRRVEKVVEEKEVEKNEIFGQENYHSLSSSPSPPPRQRQPMRRSMEKFRERDVGQNAICEAKMTDFPLPAPSKSRHGRMRSVGDVPKWEVEQNPNILVEKPHTSPLNPPPSPPQHQEEAVEEEELVEKTSLKKRRSGGAKDIASAIALLYPKKKKGSKTKKSSNDTALLSAEPSSSAPPPPPTLPSSVFHHLFYQKKGGNKARQIHSESAAPPPPPPMPPPPEQQSTQQAIQPPVPAPAASYHNWYRKGKEKVYLYESPLSPPPAPPSLLEKSNLSKHTLQASSSMSPTPPRPPPPPPRRPPHSHQTVTDEEVAANHNLNRRVIEGQAMKLKEREAVPVSCPSQDVDDKADLFIARLHANWKLEKQKSKRDKERRKQESQLRRA